VLETTKRISGSDARFVFVPRAKLLAAGIAPWTDLPLWMPGVEGEAFARIDSNKAAGVGLVYRSLEETGRERWNGKIRRRASQCDKLTAAIGRKGSAAGTNTSF
jgi:hypothetical protein